MLIAIAALTASVRAALARVAAWRAGQRGYARLCSMDDRMLKDVGLTRGDLRAASSARLFDDPTTILADKARERRTSRPVTRRAPDAQARLAFR